MNEEIGLLTPKLHAWQVTECYLEPGTLFLPLMALTLLFFLLLLRSTLNNSFHV